MSEVSENSLKNLRKLKEFTPEERREIARKAGIASGKARKEKKDFQEACKTILNMSLKQGKVADLEKIKSMENLSGKNLSVIEAIVLKQVQKALISGDTKAAEFVRDSAGMKAPEKQDVSLKTPIIFEGEDELLE